MKLRSLHLKNFQSHSDTLIEFDPHTNAIIGKSDAGKSVIIRAFLALCFKEKMYMKHGSLACSITGIFDNGLSFERSQKINGAVKSENFIITHPGAKPQRFSKIGRELPVEVVDAIKMYEIDFGDGFFLNLNVQSQHDAKFGLSSNFSPSNRAKLCGLHGTLVIDQSVTYAAKELRRTSQLINDTQVAQSVLSSKISKDKGLPELRQRYTNAQQSYQKIESITPKIQLLESLKSKLNIAPPVDKLSLANDLLNLYGRMKRLLIMLQVRSIKAIPPKMFVEPSFDVLKDLGSRLRLLDQLKRAPKVLEPRGAVDVDLGRLREMRSRLSDLNYHIIVTDRIKSQMARVEMSYSQLSQYTHDHDEFLRSGVSCPLCSQPIRIE